MRRALLVAAGVLALAPASASAHSLVRVEGGELRYTSADAVSLNTLTVTASARSYRIVDSTVEGGIDPGPCAPGDVDRDGFIREVVCPARGIARVHADLGNQDDRARLAVPVPATILGGPGRDNLTGTAQGDLINGEGGNDEIAAGAGDDKLAGGAGDDRLDGGAGADVVHGGTGVDAIECGEGPDRAAAEDGDTVAPACEDVQRGAGDAGLPPELAVKADRVAPQLLLGGARRQRLGSRFTVLATSSELGTLRASATIRVAGRRFRLPGLSATVAVEGEGIDLEFSLPARIAAAARRARGGINVRVSVVASDREGNRTVPGIQRALTLTR